MFKLTTSPGLLKKYSPPWCPINYSINKTSLNKLPSIYELLYLYKPTELHVNIKRNTQVGTEIIIDFYYEKYCTRFHYTNKDCYKSWLTISEKCEETNHYRYIGITPLLSHELTVSLIRHFPKQLRKTFRELLLVKEIPRKWKALQNCLKDITAHDGSNVTVPTVLSLELLQAGSYPLQIVNSERLIKTYFYFKG